MFRCEEGHKEAFVSLELELVIELMRVLGTELNPV